MRWFVAVLLMVSVAWTGCKDGQGDKGKPGDQGMPGDPGVPADKGTPGDQAVPADKGTPEDQGAEWIEAALGNYRVFKGKAQLTTDAELRKLERGILERVQANRTRSCPRPVLRGEAADGSAAEDIVAVVEGSEDTQACLDALKEHSERLFGALDLPKDQPVKGWPVRYGRALPPVQADASLDGLAKVCDPLLVRVRRAVAHGDACSPFLPGLRGQPAYVNLVRTSRYLALTARGLLAAGKVRLAAELVLDGLRFCQDASRGPTSLIEAMVAVGATPGLLAVLEEVLNYPEPVGDGLLASIEAELGLLVKTTAHPSDYLSGEMDSMALYALLPAVKPEGWAPPGGWGKDGLPPNADGAAAELDGLSPLDGAVLAWIAMAEMWSEVLEGCQASDLPSGCHERMHEMAQDAAEVPTDDWSAMAEMLEAAVAGDKRAALRRKVIDILKAVAGPGLDRYVARQGGMLFTLQALKLQAAARRLVEKGGDCLTVTAFDSAPLKDLRTDPYSGQPIRVESVAAGRLALWPPVPLGKQAGLDAEPGVFVVCPKTGK